MSHFGFQQRGTFPPVAKLSNMPGSSERLISHSRLFFRQTAELWMACTESSGRSWVFLEGQSHPPGALGKPTGLIVFCSSMGAPENPLRPSLTPPSAARKNRDERTNC